MTATYRAVLAVLVVAGVLTVTPVAATASVAPASPTNDSATSYRAVESNGADSQSYITVLTRQDTEFGDVVATAAGGPSSGSVVVGYSRFGDTDPLEHETRESLHERIAENPGTYVAELARRTDTHVSTVRYHVRVLVDEGLVERRSERGRTHLSPAGSDDGPAPAVEDGTRRSILDSLAQQGAATGEELSERLDLSKSTLSYHLQRLADDGLIAREEAGREVVNVLTATVDGTRATAQD
ncbi:winged helix-turn-helix transcriptional regulator [Haloarcula litorea]|uniref:winged helix-turn-helix transcriptional regulator n=1 Tax=Haloarcula litorea TaxID=3032579 RepID=UPI0023E87D7E|nr:helix-turn-helix domain-containing protein [Halomicroarcula sp. GDY20]